MLREERIPPGSRDRQLEGPRRLTNEQELVRLAGCERCTRRHPRRRTRHRSHGAIGRSVDRRGVLAFERHDEHAYARIRTGLQDDSVGSRGHVIDTHPLERVLRVEERGSHLERPVEIEPAHVEHLREGNVAVRTADDARHRVGGANAPFDVGDVTITDEIDLVHDDDVRERDLLVRLGLMPQVQIEVLRVDERHDAVEPKATRVEIEGGRGNCDRLGSSEARHAARRLGEAARILAKVLSARSLLHLGVDRDRVPDPRVRVEAERAVVAERGLHEPEVARARLEVERDLRRATARRLVDEDVDPRAPRDLDQREPECTAGTCLAHDLDTGPGTLRRHRVAGRDLTARRAFSLQHFGARRFAA
jgi:hypothetical protein